MAAVRIIRSAGGVVWRDGPAGIEIAVIHRDRYDDWSLPKGKLNQGEHVLAAAVREIREETGIVAIPQLRLPRTHYLTGVPDIEKTVDFWSMRAASLPATFAPNDEVDALEWVDVRTADARLTYAHDRGVVAAFTALPPITGVAIVVRHAHAGAKKGYPGPDDRRPLDRDGKREVAALRPILELFRPERVYAAPLVRCVDTVAQIGKQAVRTDSILAAATAAPPEEVAARLRELTEAYGRIVVCSQGEVIPDAIKALRPATASTTQTFELPKGAAFVCSFAGPDVMAADPLRAYGM